MSDSGENEKGACTACEAVGNLTKRMRSITSISLDWLAERFRKTQNVKEKLADGSYSVDTSTVAKAILNDDRHK